MLRRGAFARFSDSSCFDRLYRLMCGSEFLKESKVPPILGGAIVVLIAIQAGV